MVNYKRFEIETLQNSSEQVAKVLIIYTGGTLGMSFDPVSKTLVPFQFKEILKGIPEMARYEARLSIIPIDPPIDSSNMTPEIWVELAGIIETNYTEFDAFVILHGTDTMAYTASALSFMLENLAKPVIFTGAQLPIGVPRTDARENIMTALELAAYRENGEAVLHEVCIYFNGRLLRGNRAKKYESSQFDAFQSENYPNLAEVGVYCDYNRPYLLSKPKEELKVHKVLDNKVAILKLFPGMPTTFLEYVFEKEGLKAVILETFGSGNANSSAEFLGVLQKAIDKGVILLNISQCSGGSVRQKDYATGRALEKIGVISGKDMTAEAAVTKLMHVLGKNLTKQESEKMLESNLCGEMTF